MPNYLSEMYGKRSYDFVYGFLAAMECYAIWKNGERHIGGLETPLKEAMIEDVRALSENPEDFDNKIESYC